MKTAAGKTRVVVWLLVSAAGLMLVPAGTASAQPPITFTDVSKFSESFSDDPFVCQDELYAQTVSGQVVLHRTYFPDTGAIHLHGTGPTYTGNFWFSDTESIRAVKSGDVLVEQDTDFDHLVARGSDGSKVLSNFHAHFTVNANGAVSVAFDKFRMVCT